MKNLGKYIPFLMFILALGFNSCSDDNQDGLIEEKQTVKSYYSEYIPENFIEAELEIVDYSNDYLEEDIHTINKLSNNLGETAYTIYTNKQEIFFSIKNDNIEIINLKNGDIYSASYLFDKDLGYNRVVFKDLEKNEQLNFKNNDCYNSCTFTFVATQVGISASFIAACAIDGPAPFADILATTAFLSFSAANANSYEQCKEGCKKQKESE